MTGSHKWTFHLTPDERIICDRCGKELKAGDWPWCQGKPEQHQNPHYGWHFAAKD